MKISITITVNDELIRKIKEYTNSSTVTEAVNFAVKDCVLVYKMRELNEKLSKKIIYVNKLQEIQRLRNLTLLNLNF